MAPQSEPSGVQRICGGALGIDTVEDGIGFAGNASSTINSASDNPIVSDNSRLVTSVFRAKVIQYSGIGSPWGVGVPPVQFSSKSPTDSASPSARTIFGMPAVALHERPE